MVTSVGEALSSFIAGRRLKRNLPLVEDVVKGYHDGTLLRAEDKKQLPYGVAVLLTRELGSDAAERLQPPDLTHNALEDQMVRFHAWFARAMCDTPHRFKLHRLKSGGRWNKPDGKAEKVPVAGRSFTETFRLQARPVVKHACVATYHCKRTLAQCGIRTSCGESGVERGHWFPRLMRGSITGVFASWSYKQFRAIKAWGHPCIQQVPFASVVRKSGSILHMT